MANINPKKTGRSKTRKNKLWKLFDTEIADRPVIECIYSNYEGDRELCEACGSSLVVLDEGFPVCSSRTCGIIYTDKLDQTAEWRYYGAEDSSASDPTRCGMPINPLLQESSFGCKVLVNGASTYEMRKIRRYTDWIGMPYKEKSQYDEFQKITILGRQS